ncbi:hypothetical protein [Candidatus Parabeggiatoa sp. HSG14]|uniref:hypothetical protein n=1 Tax=Candidatus Parabeggiatoa sp. HSG14 TaxID=3055593 RepID=UPI0025A7A3B1|nr:hypothetical protein [Thiotrichales bacterium HSG14]
MNTHSKGYALWPVVLIVSVMFMFPKWSLADMLHAITAGYTGEIVEQSKNEKIIPPIVIPSQSNNTRSYWKQLLTDGENKSRTRKGNEKKFITVDRQNVNQELAEICEKIDRTVRNFLGCEIISILAKPDRVESFKVSPKWNPKKRDNALSGFPIIKQGADLSGELLKNFQTLIFDKSSYLLETKKRCFFRPKVGLRFIRDENEVDVLLSFSCDTWLFSYGKIKKLEDFDPIRKKLTEMKRFLFEN